MSINGQRTTIIASPITSIKANPPNDGDGKPRVIASSEKLWKTSRRIPRSPGCRDNWTCGDGIDKSEVADVARIDAHQCSAREKEMQSMKLLKTFAALLFVALATGCAFTPQTVVIDPTVEVPAGNIGEGRNVSVYVVDERTTTELGRRGVGMRGAAITTEQDIATVFQTSIVENLNAMGFNATAATEGMTDPGSSLLRVDIRSIDYETSMGFWTGGVHTRGSMKATATRDARNYENLYRVDEEKRVMVVPGADSNAQMINATASAILQELFNDVALFRFLAE